MRRRAFPAIVGVTVAVLVAVMVFLAFGMNRQGPGLASVFSAKPAPPPSIPVAETAAPLLSSGTPALKTLTNQEVAAEWAKVQVAANEGKWQTWAQVVDADTGEVVFSSDASVSHTPASTQKVLTSLFALSALDPGETLETGISQSGDNLYLWGEGDLMLGSGTSDATRVNGHAGLGTLAEETASALSALGTNSVVLNYQDTLFSGTKRSPSWASQGVADFAGDVGPFAVDTGRVAPGAWEFVADSQRSAAEELSAQLQQRGIAVSAVQVGVAPPEAQEIAVVSSAPVIDQINYLVETSDNTLAEQYCHLATAASGTNPDFSSSTGALMEFLQSSGLHTEGVIIADCSGLDENSRVTGQILTDAILSASAHEDARGSLARLFPVGGMTGTLEDRFESAPTLGNVEAKTGSLGHATTLAGTLTTASGQNLVFAVGNDHVPDDAAYWTRDYLDEFIGFLASS